MKYQLIMLPQPILVSGYGGEIGDSVFLANGYNYVSKIVDIIGGSCRDIVLSEMPKERGNGTLDYREMYKIIAGIPELPAIDFSALSEADCKKIGWIDVEMLAMEAYCKNKNTIATLHADTNYYLGYSDGFKVAQSLEKKFSEEDFVDFLKYNEDYKYNASIEDNLQTWFIKKSQPKVFDVEVEMEEGELLATDDNGKQIREKQSKIINNSIKIIKVL